MYIVESSTGFVGVRFVCESCACRMKCLMLRMFDKLVMLIDTVWWLGGERADGTVSEERREDEESRLLACHSGVEWIIKWTLWL